MSQLALRQRDLRSSRRVRRSASGVSIRSSPIGLSELIKTGTSFWRASDYSGAGNWLDGTNAGRDAVLGAATAAPTFLPHSGTDYVKLPGVAGSFLETPDHNDLDIVGDMSVRCAVALDDWTPTAVNTLVDKKGTVSGYSLYLNTNGTIEFAWGNGILDLARTSTVAVGAADRALVLIRVDLDVANGAAGHNVLFYTKTGVTEANAATELALDTGWTQLGATVTAATVTSIAANASLLIVGMTNAATLHATGKFYSVVVKNGINGTTVFAFGSTQIALANSTQTNFLDTTGKVITVTRSAGTGLKAEIVEKPKWAFDGVNDLMTVAHHASLDLVGDGTLVAVVRQHATPAASQYLVSKRQETENGRALARLSGASGPAFVVDTGSQISPGVSRYSDGERANWTARRSGSACDALMNRLDGTDGAMAGDTANTRSLFVGARENTGGAGVDFFTGTIYGIAWFQGRALTADQIAQVGKELVAETYVAPTGLLSIPWHTAFIARTSDLFQSDLGVTPVTAEAQAIGQWRDVENGHHATQATAANQPLFRASAANMNGKPAVDFDGINDFLATAAFTALTQPSTIVVIGQSDNGVSDVGTFVDGIVGTSRHVVGARGITDWAIYAGTILTYDTIRDTARHLFVAFFNGATSALDFDGTQVVTGNAGAQTLTGLIVGKETVNAELDGNIYFIGLINRALTAGEKATILAEFQAL